MAKLTTYLVMMGGMMLIFYFGGILSSSPTIVLMTHISTIASSGWWIAVTVLLGLLVSAGLYAGYITRDSRVLELMAYAPIVYLLFEFAWDIIAIYIYMFNIGEGASIIASLLFSPLVIVYIMTLIEWYRGMTT